MQGQLRASSRLQDELILRPLSLLRLLQRIEPRIVEKVMLNYLVGVSGSLSKKSVEFESRIPRTSHLESEFKNVQANSSFMSVRGFPDGSFARSNNSTLGALEKLEAMLVQNMIGSIFPKEGFGGLEPGISSEYWSSLLSDQLANSIAASGQLGISKLFQKNLSP